MKSLSIIGAGAAGMFCAAALRGAKGLRISILEASGAPLKKVLLSGGGRCNFTNAAIDGGNPKDFYPRGAGHLRKPLRAFGCEAARGFFRSIGAESKTEGDGRVFPVSDDSRTVADALVAAAAECEMRLGFRADSLRPAGDGWEIGGERGGRRETLSADFALIATGGRWQRGLRKSVEALGGKFSEPVPTLFPLDLDRAGSGGWGDLSGVSAADALVAAAAGGREFSARGALLITRPGIGGPAALRLSAFGAREFAECGYRFPLRINWIPQTGDGAFKREILSARASFPKRAVRNAPLFGLPRSLWEYLCRRAGVSERLWANFSKSDEAALKAALAADEMRAAGKSAHKGEFATCGGLECGCVDFKTCSLKGRPTLFLAGECLDIDGVTGGFNLHAAWATAKICADSIKNFVKSEGDFARD